METSLIGLMLLFSTLAGAAGGFALAVGLFVRAESDDEGLGRGVQEGTDARE